MKQLTFKIPEDLARAFRVLAAEEDTSMTDLLVKWIKAHTPARITPREYSQGEVDDFGSADVPPTGEIKAWLKKK